MPQLCAEALRDAGTRRRWSAGSILIREGEASAHVMVVEAGRVKVASSTVTGKHVLLAIRGPGDLLGEFAAIDGRVRSASVTALSPVTATVVPGERFRALLLQDGAVAFGLLQIVVGRLREADIHRLEYGAFTVTERIARLLLDYADRYGEADERRVVIALPLSQTELAHAAGASREAVAKALRKLRDLGAVRTSRRQVELLRPDALAEIAEGLPSVHLDADVPGPRR